MQASAEAPTAAALHRGPLLHWHALHLELLRPPWQLQRLGTCAGRAAPCRLQRPQRVQVAVLLLQLQLLLLLQQRLLLMLL